MKKIFNWFGNLFNKTKKLALQFIAPSIAVVQAIKAVVDSPLVPVIVSVIPGNVDNMIYMALRKHLPRVLQILRISDECLSIEQPDKIIICCIKKLREYEPDGKAAAYHSIAALLAHYASDKKLTWTECVKLSEAMYKKNKFIESENI